MFARHLLGGFAGDMAITDVRNYLTTPTPGAGAGGSTLYTPIQRPGQTYWDQVIMRTPGLMHRWRMGFPEASWGARVAEAPYYYNSAGPTTLWTTGSAGAVSGLIPGVADGAVQLTGGYLEAFDYRAWSSALEILSIEIVLRIDTLKADAGLCGQWKASDGYLIREDGADLYLHVGGQDVHATSVLSTGQTYHIAGVIGGQQAAVPDYYTRLYLNGADVANGLLTGSLASPAATRFLIGQYADGAGTNGARVRVQECSVYSRMLQPDEITQHYQAMLGNVWP